MDWDRATEVNRQAMKQIVAALFAMAGLTLAGLTLAGRPLVGVADAPTLPRRLHRAVLRLLRPAESAVRRLVIVAARGLVLSPRELRRRAAPADARARPRSRRRKSAAAAGTCESSIVPRLPLFDVLNLPRLRRPVRSSVPRICTPGYSKPFPIKPRRAPMPHDALDARRLAARLLALEAALDDLPGHARRYARWRDRPKEAPRAPAGGRRRFARIVPLRPGPPPGFPRRRSRRRPLHEVHERLDILHGLAVWSRKPGSS